MLTEHNTLPYDPAGPWITDPALIAQEFGIEHRFDDGLYTKVIRMRQHSVVLQHSHPFDHDSELVSGRVALTADGVLKILQAPWRGVLAAGVQHRIEALEDSVWHCIHVTDETDPAKIDDVILRKV